MTTQAPDVDFRQEPLLFLDRVFPAAGDSVWLPDSRQLCVAEAAAARAVLSNDDGLYEDHSDFFHTRRGLFGPRSVQVEMGRSARAILRTHLRAHAPSLPAAVERALAPISEWPDAGNWLVYRHLAGALASPDSPPRLLRTMDEIVRRAVLAGARDRYSRLTRAVFRFRVMRELSRAVRERRARPSESPRDVLDAMVAATDSGVPAADLGELFLSFLFAVAGSVGFVLGWSVYLLGTHPPTNAEPSWVVQEALRLWPVAWMLGRQPAKAHEVAGAPARRWLRHGLPWGWKPVDPTHRRSTYVDRSSKIDRYGPQGPTSSLKCFAITRATCVT